MKPNFKSMTAAMALSFYTLTMAPGVAYADAQAICNSIEAARQASIQNSMQAYVPPIDPASALSSMSCIDKLLSLPINFGLWFDPAAWVDKLVNQLMSKACAAANKAWQSTVGKVNDRINGTVNNLNSDLSGLGGAAGIKLNAGQGSTSTNGYSGYTGSINGGGISSNQVTGPQTQGKKSLFDNIKALF